MSLLGGWQESPSYKEFVVGTIEFVARNVRELGSNYTFPEDTRQDFVKCLRNLEWFDLFAVIFLSFFWTLLRHLSTEYLFKVSKALAPCCYFCLLLSLFSTSFQLVLPGSLTLPYCSIYSEFHAQY